MKKTKNLLVLYIIVICFVALATGFSDSVLSNYFKDAYNVTTIQRGFIELPLETPGILAVFVIAALSRLGDIKITVISQLLAFAGIMTLGVTTPQLYIMTVVLFVYSIGAHMYMPLTDSIAMSIVEPENLGKSLGRFKGISIAAGLVASITVFIGFKTEIFSFKTQIKHTFVLAGIFFLLSAIFLLILSQKASSLNRKLDKPKLVFKKEYKYYYILAIMNGVQKQIVLVYAPWVIIDLLGRGADTTSLLLIISSICGIFFLPFLGRCIDRFGIKKMLYADAMSFILVYSVFACIVYNIYVGNYKTTGFAAIMTFAVFVFDRMSSQMGIIRTIYLKNIATDDSDVLPTISLGITLDHVVAISCSFVSGLIWTAYGPHVIFVIAASFSIVNLVVAKLVVIK